MSAPALTPAAIRARLLAREPKRLPTSDRTKLSAVAAVLRFHDEPEVMLIRRAERPSDHWSGHMAFPGGRHDPTDPSTLHTAIRETHEEVSVDLHAGGRLLGRLDDVQAISKGIPRDLLIVPYVFELTEPVTPVIDPAEVAEVVWVGLEPMMRGELDCTRPYVHDGVPLELPGFRVGENIVWGLTYRMLELLFDVIRR